MSQSGEPSQEELVDVESDNTATFGPTQYPDIYSPHDYIMHSCMYAYITLICSTTKPQ